MIFKFRMLSDENDNFVRDYEVPYDMSLKDFHDFVGRSLGYGATMASFFTADEHWEKLREFTLFDMGGSGEEGAPVPMESVLLGQILRNNRDRLIYQFDLINDRSLYLELTEAKRPEAGMEYPRVAFEHAPAPDPFDPEKNRDEGSIFEQMMDGFNDSFDGDDSYDDE